MIAIVGEGPRMRCLSFGRLSAELGDDHYPAACQSLKYVTILAATTAPGFLKSASRDAEIQ